MLTIYKYPLTITDLQVLMLPLGARILSIAGQHGQLMLWALVNPDTDHLQTFHVSIFGTGNPIFELPGPNGFGDFVGTVILDNLVWHVFVRTDHDA